MPRFLKKGGAAVNSAPQQAIVRGKGSRVLTDNERANFAPFHYGDTIQANVPVLTRKNNNTIQTAKRNHTRSNNVLHMNRIRPNKQRANVQNAPNVYHHANVIQPARRLTLANYRAASAKQAHQPLHSLMLRNTGTRKLFRK